MEIACLYVGIWANVFYWQEVEILKEELHFPLWFCYKLCIEIKRVI